MISDVVFSTFRFGPNISAFPLSWQPQTILRRLEPPHKTNRAPKLGTAHVATFVS